MPLLQTFIVSTRPGRKGDAIARWFDSVARRHGGFDVELVDLAEVNLPLFDEPKHPRFRTYQHDHTKRWSERVSRADAFVFVTPEYNYSPPPSLINALDYLAHEWAYKPVGFVSYGGVSGGTRSVQMSKLQVTALKMMPIPEAVSLPFFTKMFAADGTFAPDETQHKAAHVMLDELRRWTDALRPLRGEK
ncbi:MAG TPA: NAD(P)H-dependent oxidoreductase [Vicinamibacterales bacterium]|nr:NAD(P)H-dependent oxidoreductase [Vicinamibacterales bacterium]